MSYPTQASPLADILEALTQSFEDNVRPLGYIIRGPHAGETCTIMRVREHDIEVEIGLNIRDVVAQDAIALIDRFGDEPTQPALTQDDQSDKPEVQQEARLEEAIHEESALEIPDPEY